MAEPEQVPTILIGRERRSFLGCLEEGLATEGKELELSSEGDIPVCVIFNDRGAKVSLSCLQHE